MKKTLMTVLVVALMSTTMAHGQPADGPPQPMNPEKREKMEAMKAAFLTSRLDLSPEEATLFWPVYNKFQKELNELRDGRHQQMKALRDSDTPLTDKDYEQIFDSELTFRQGELDIMKKYNGQLKKSLPMKKLAKLHRAEEEFKRELLNRMRENDHKPDGQRQRNRG